MSSITRKVQLTTYLVVVLLLAAFLFARTASTASAPDDVVPDRYIVKVAPGANPVAVAQAHELAANHVYSHAFHGFSAVIPEARLDALADNPNVLSIVPDRVVAIAAPPWCPDDPDHPACGDDDDDGGDDNIGQEIPTGILRINGDLSSTASGDGTGTVDVDVAVIDTGIDVDHPDLNVVGGINCSNGNSFDDGNGHGSHVAGTIGAIDDGAGVVGVAPGARLYAVRVLDNSGRGSWSSVICGVDWVTANNDTIEVANMSLGGSGDEGSCNDGGLREAICASVEAGVTYAVAAGNSSEDAQNFVPATYPEVITVSALADFDGEPGGNGEPTCRDDEDDTFANFSNFGDDVDLIAPGVCILSTWKNGDYNTISGTSMASPHVAGAAALYKASNPGASPTQVENALENAGSFDWDNSDDGDNTQEPLLDVQDF